MLSILTFDGIELIAHHLFGYERRHRDYIS